MIDYSSPSRFPFGADRAGIEDRREVSGTGSTPPAVFASLAATRSHLNDMQRAEPTCTVVVDGKTLPAGRGYSAVTVFR